MRAFLLKQLYGNSFLDWAIFLGAVIGSVLIGKILYFISTNYLKGITEKTETKLDDILIDMVEEPMVIFISLLGIKYSLRLIKLPIEINKFCLRATDVLMVCVVGWGILRIFNSLMDEYVKPLTESTDTVWDDQILIIFKKGVNLLIISLTILVAISNAGYNIGTILAGLGIGGLAFALAAQDTVGNFFGGITIIADKPFKVKDRVVVHGHDGIVEDIGLRSTKIRTSGENRLVTIPNSMFTNSIIKNVSSEPARTIDMNLGLTYNHSSEQMKLAMKILSDIIKNNPHVEDDCIISFNEFTDSSLNIKLRYYIKKDENYFNTLTEINTEILEKFNANNLDFAFPTQTLYIKKEHDEAAS